MPIGQVILGYNPSLDYKPLGMWAYFGYDILFAIPLIGLMGGGLAASSMM